MKRVRRLLKKLPIVREIAQLAKRRRAANKARDFSSADYWEARYREGRNSGAGSYNRLANFKAEVINHFVAEHDVRSVIEFGCGDGAQLQLATYPSYIGVDVSHTVLASIREKFRADPAKIFVHADGVSSDQRCDLSMSLDVIYHLVEDEVYERHMAQLFNHADRFVIIYSSNREHQGDAVHVRHRRFADWVERNQPDFRQIGFEKNRYPEDPKDSKNSSFADFYFYQRDSFPAEN